MPVNIRKDSIYGDSIPEQSPLWKDRANMLLSKSSDVNIFYKGQYEYGKTEVGLKNRKSRSYIKISDDSNIDLYSNNQSGISINGANDSILMNASNINLASEYVFVSSNPNGLVINGYAMNPQLYQLADEDLQLDATIVKAGTNERKSIHIRPFIKFQPSNRYDELLSKVGIPI
jgi:hypothetical protein